MKMKKFLNKLTESPIFWGIVVAFVFVFLFLYHLDSRAQNVTRKGDTFYQDTTSSNKIEKDVPTLTGYYYMTKDGVKYPIYKSSKGKCFILRTSKSGKQYKQYLPEITKQLCYVLYRREQPSIVNDITIHRGNVNHYIAKLDHCKHENR